MSRGLTSGGRIFKAFGILQERKVDGYKEQRFCPWNPLTYIGILCIIICLFIWYGFSLFFDKPKEQLRDILGTLKWKIR